MTDPRTLVGRALSADPDAVHALVLHLAPAMQREVNAALLARNLVPQAGRHDVVDLVRDLLLVLFEDQGALLRSWSPNLDLQAWAGRLGAVQSAAVLDRAVPLAPEQAPGPDHVEAWWRAAQAQDPSTLPVIPEQRAHAQALLRPLTEHEQHALAAEVVASRPTAPAAPASASGDAPAPTPGPAPDAASSVPTARPRRAKTSPHRRKALTFAAALAVITIGGVVIDRLTSDPYEDLTPPFTLKARKGQGDAPAIYAVGEQMQVRLRPASKIPWDARTPTGGPLLLGVDAYARDAALRTLTWRHAATRDARGDLVLTGVVGKDLPIDAGDWELFFLVGPREHLGVVGTEDAVADEAPPPPIRRLRYRVRVLDMERLVDTSTAG